MIHFLSCVCKLHFIFVDSYTSEIRFVCNESIGIGAPKLLLVSEIIQNYIKYANYIEFNYFIVSFFFFIFQESQCSAEFEWHTEVICVKHANSQAAADQKAEILEELSPSHGK